MASVLWWMNWTLWRIIIHSYHSILAIYFWPRSRRIVPPIKNQLLLKSAKELAEEIREGKLRSKDVVKAYIERIQEVNPYINAVVQERYKEALKEAKEVDAVLQSGQFTKNELAVKKPLLGVPVTIKMLFNVKGFKSTAGSLFFKNVTAENDAPTVTLLKNAGAIVLATTNSPEFGFTFETTNLVNGTTCNPYDTRRTPGGSSGGEGALLAAGGSVIGLGNDLVGSLRIPAHFTGVFSHKPTRGLIQNTGTFPTIHPGISPYLYTGPMCRYAEDLVTMTKVLMSNNDQKLAFDKQMNFKNLKIYYSTKIGDPRIIPVDGEIVNAMHKAVKHFTETYGITAEEVKVPHLSKTNDAVIHLIQAPIPKLTEFFTHGKVESMNMVLELFRYLIRIPRFSFGVIIFHGFAKFPFLFKEKNIPHFQKVLEMIEDEFNKLLDDNSVFMYPTFPVTAPYHLGTIPLIAGCCYTNTFNFIGLPATNVPLGLNRDGMPHGMQIIGKNNNDPLTIACAIELSKVFNGWIPPGSQV